MQETINQIERSYRAETITVDATIKQVRSVFREPKDGGDVVLGTTFNLTVKLPPEAIRNLSIAALADMPFTLWVDKVPSELEVLMRVPTIRIEANALVASFNVKAEGLSWREVAALSVLPNLAEITLRPRC